jgi:hypothetical protein
MTMRYVLAFRWLVTSFTTKESHLMNFEIFYFFDNICNTIKDKLVDVLQNIYFKIIWSRDSSVGITKYSTGWITKKLRFDSGRDKRFFCISKRPDRP